MIWQRLFASILVILTIIIFENVSSYPDLDRAKRFEDGEDVGEPLYLTPLINANQLTKARVRAQVRLPDMQGNNRRSYAGFLTVNKDTNSNLFFWFISAEVNADNAPVIVYLEGGPGRTSFFNLFLQHGPFIFKSDDKLVMQGWTWNERYNMIYIDSPAGTGFSFMNEDAAYLTNQIHIVDELLEALKQIFQMCYRFRRNEVYVAGESMAGKLVPALTSAIHWYNKKEGVSQTEKINLKGMIIGNGLMDPENQLAYGKYLHAMGLIDEKTALQLKSLETQARGLIGQKTHVEAYDVVTNLFAQLRQKIGYCSADDIRKPEFKGDPYHFVHWLERSDVRNALHVGNQSFTVLSYKTIKALKGDMTRSSATTFGHMLEYYRALVYTGNLGIACPYSSLHQSLLKIEWSGKQQFLTTEGKQWRVTERDSDVLAGYVKNYGNLYEVLVRNAGHFPSLDHPERILELLDRFTQKRL